MVKRPGPAAPKTAPVKKTKPAVKKAGAKTPAKVKALAPKPKPKPKMVRGGAELDFSAFSPEALLHEHRWICLACVLDVFTRQLGLAPATAQSQIRRYTPSAHELTAETPTRPYLGAAAGKHPCPWCSAPPRWHVPLRVHRIESGKATDTARRDLVKALGTGENFQIVEEKSTQRDAFYDWLQHTSAALNLDDPRWLLHAAHHYLARKHPRTEWAPLFAGVYAIRRSRRLTEGWETEPGRLFLAPRLFDEILLVQYLLSRSHRSGGLTFEGRLTLPELISRLRGAGYLRASGVSAGPAGDAFEQLVELLGGGEAGMKFYYVVDRRALLAKLAELKNARIPRAKQAAH